ncbi:TVP38/TMEM64 family protein [Spirochaetota bacterium]
MNRNILKKIIITGVIAALVVLFFVFDLGRYLKLEYLKNSRDYLMKLYLDNRALVIAVYMGIYILSAALSIPGAVILTLAGGALFGVVSGTIIISFASTIGATLACFVSRYLLRDWVQSKFEDKLATVNRGIEEEGLFYLFTLRLIPVFPFWLINLVMGLTKMKLYKFYWVSQVGMLAGTIVYVNAGSQLAKIEKVSDILSPGIIISFVILGIFPLLVKKLFDLYKKNKSKKKVEES